MSQAGSSRWSPTTEQLMILEELYRGGVRNPTAFQVQHITTHLSFYGRIEGKNVFYWFQNHKARDRQKLRRRLNKQMQLQQQLQVHHFHLNQHVLGGFHSSPCYSTQKFSLCNSACLLSLGGADTSTQATNCTGCVHDSQSLVQNTQTTFCNDGCWTLVDGDQASSCCTQPLQTLDLFPVTATKLKEDCTTASTNNLSHIR